MRAYERLMNYAKVHTTSQDGTGRTPTTERQLDLARMLAEEMRAMGIADARVDGFGYVYGSLPATPGCEKSPAIGWIAHMDTAQAFSGENVKPILHENYDGGDVALPQCGRVLKTSEFPFLKELKGKTLITADGSTLLGADDKAGIAEILTACCRRGRCLSTPRAGRAFSTWTLCPETRLLRVWNISCATMTGKSLRRARSCCAAWKRP